MKARYRIERGARPLSRGMRAAVYDRQTGALVGVAYSRAELIALTLAAEPVAYNPMPGARAAIVRRRARYL